MAAAPSAKKFTREEVARHADIDKSPCLIVIHEKVYDISKFAKVHPGGKAIIASVGGKDATDEFASFHLHRLLQNPRYEKLVVGTVEGDFQLGDNQTGVDEMPYGEPFHLRATWAPNPAYYNESHARFRLGLRKYLSDQFEDIKWEYETDGTPISDEMYQDMGRAGILAARVGVDAMELCRKLMDEGKVEMLSGLKPEEFDAFHELIAHAEFGRLGASGFIDGLGSGYVISAPNLVHFANADCVDTLFRDVVLGDRRICLAVSEPQAGSDVANVHTVAKRVTVDGREYYEVSGSKKWITNGMGAHYFVTAVRTGKAGMSGMSFLCIKRDEATVKTVPIKTAYSPTAGTALVLFEKTLVPCAECSREGGLLGQENGGFMLMMQNFSHERWIILALVVSGLSQDMSILQKWTVQRRAFGKRLIDQPVIRLHLARCISQVEALQAQVDILTFQMKEMDFYEQSAKLAAPISMAKFHMTRTITDVSDYSSQIVGGRSLTKTGMGARALNARHAFKFASVLGGSEEILIDMATRMSLQQWPRDSKL